MIKKLVITVTPKGEFVCESSYQTTTGDWTVMNRTVINYGFPMFLVSRVAHRDDYKVFIRIA